MEYLKYYTNAFKNSFNYKDMAKRKEFNFFILFYILFWMILFIPFMFGMPIVTMLNNINPIIPFGGFAIVSWIFFIVHAFPFLALIKRRIIDITPSKANLIFWIFITLEIIRIFISISFMVILYTNQGQFHIWYIFIGLVNQALCTISLGFIIFLMVKKGA